jgi:peptidoglycan/LPS O-acetylase OafA/YrhL
VSTHSPSAALASDRGDGPPDHELPYLPGLDGIRAIAVGAVILFHAGVAGCGGGFFGVEVFFVISGYLIASLLFAEQRRSGGVSLARFWTRRARRLLPALALVLIAAMAIAATLAPDAYFETRDALPAAVFFFTNWWQILLDQSYFMAVARPPLLQHLWSLAVEEQFYLVVPPLLALVFRIRGRVPRGGIVIVSAAVGIASACWMAKLYDAGVDPGRIYLRTDTRLSGLLLGVALAAVRAPWPTAAASRWVRSALDALGLAGLGAVLWAFTQCRDTDPFVYKLGFLGVDVATMAIIASCVGPSRVRGAIGWTPLRWIGLRSYGLYLWHWPILAVTRPEFDTTLTGGRLLGLRLALIVVAAELSYRFVEVPVRRGALSSAFRVLAGRGTTVERARVWRVGAVTAFVGLAIALASAAPVRAEGPHDSGAASGLAEAQPDPGAATSPMPATLGASAESAPVEAHGIPLDAAWPKTLTILTDSVTLGVKQALPAALPGWNVEFVGRPALMVKQVVPEFLKDRPRVGSVVVIGLAYNSLFEENRRNYGRWAVLWDREAEQLLSDLRARGAKKFVWVTLREPSPEVVTDRGRSQYRMYAWFFPYVNERLHALVERHPEIALADWRAVADEPGLTADLIHLNTAGARLMTRTIVDAVLGPPS